MKCLGDGTSVRIVRSIKRSILSSIKRPATRIPISKRLFRSNALSVSVALSVLLVAVALSASLLARGGSVAAFTESIGTFQSDNCTTPKTSWNLGQSACAVAIGASDDRRIAWVAPNGAIAQFSSTFTGTGTDTYAIPLSNDPFSQVGTWSVRTVDNSGGGFAVATFLVLPPNNNPNVDLLISKFGPDQASPGNNLTYRIEVINQGPDAAQNVVLTEQVPANTTFVSATQDSGLPFTCTNPSAGCTIASLPVNTLASFTFVYNVNGGTPNGTVITNTATIASSTNELHQPDNTATYNTRVVSAPAPSPCIITCPANLTLNNDPNATNPCTKIVTYSTATISGDCADSDTGQTPSVVCSPPSNSAFPVGTTTVVCGVGGTLCNFTVKVVDTRSTPLPLITCPSDVTVGEESPGAGSATVNYPAPSATGNCVQVTCNPASGSSFPVGITTVSCIVTDFSEPPHTASCSFTVTVNTVAACTLTCPSNITKNNDPGDCGAVATYTTPPAGQGCGTVTCDPASNSFFPVGTTTVTCTATDAGGNTIATCIFMVTVNDTNTLICPANINTTENPPGSGSAIVNYQTPTACSGPPVTCTPPSGSTFPVGTTTVTCTNTGSCTFTVTVSSSSCTITCSANKTVNNDPNQCGAVVTYSAPTTSGNCGSDPPTCEPPSGSFFPVVTTTVTCTSARAGAQCSFTVTVNDTSPPVIGSCPANVTKNNDPGQCSAVVTYTAPSASDNCSGATVSCNPPSGSAFPKGTTTVTCTAHDASNNTASCQFTVTVNDAENPTISCPANIVKPTDPNVCSAVVSFSATANDNCPGVTYSCNPATGSTFQKGTTTVTCTATDTSSHTASCQFTVTVNDTQPPAITCPANIVVEPTCPAGANATYVPVVSDNCPGVAFVCSPASGSTFPVGTTTVTCTATDTSNNTAQCSFTVTVLTVSAVIENLKTSVNNSSLTGTQKQGLISKLNAALDALAQGHTNTACQKLADFINSVQNFIDHGDISATQGQAWINSAAHVRNALGCTNLPCS